ncbi:IclR family transcriptional regulator [Muricoccus pecuniae]|uniref:DNA-binding IclR family transcriptional regulator n=1 Tax=Muricoccus pecuniae TaxID=693023 RepID=A0A840XZ39_9PROT|nr:helix-turn-helix domain-containing protein [Roseomonas pecuniae]MBB5693156.1 DNA-binding IclR family transcriptional regulator [Roseomonas pecuniae]
MAAGAPEGEPPPSGVLERGLLVLSCFTEERPRLHLRDFAAITGLDKATLLRMLGTLAAHGYVRRGEDGRYAPGSAPLRLAALYHATTDFPARMMPVLEAVAERTGESAAFYAREGEDRVCLLRANAPRALRRQVETGERLPLRAGGAAAHVLLAHTGGETPFAAEVLSRGHLSTAAQRDPELASVALPVFEGDGRFIGALVVSGPVSRQTEAGFARAREIAAGLLHGQGFSVSPRHAPSSSRDSGDARGPARRAGAA